MTELKIESVTLPSANFNGVSSLPAVAEQTGLAEDANVFELSDDDGLFLNYGKVKYAYPYRAQDNYDRALEPKKVTLAVLENEYLRAEFLPDFGGKLRSLYDKEAGRELLFVNSVVRPCHLGIRNAWMSGGVEFNCGYVGHNPFTCDKMHTARTELPDKTPVLRFYQYERIRGAVYQIDCFLPSGSRMLYIRPRIVNPTFRVLPMYWWSNIAVPDEPGARVIVPADEAYTKRDRHTVKLPVPVYNGINETYPSNNIISIDYFWNVPENARKFITLVDKSGYGLVQTSTARLKGRKLFVWGKSAGGDRWKNFLTADNESGSYCEIQAGLAKTQYECLPMPPKTAWEWCEAYGAMNMDPAAAHGDWNTAKAAAESRLAEMLSESEAEELLRSTKAAAVSPAGVIFSADGWGALEEERRRVRGEDAMAPHLNFGETGEEQKPWVNLLNSGSCGEADPDLPPVSYIYGGEWKAMLREAAQGPDAKNWFTLLQLGLCEFIDGETEKAESALLKSLQVCRTPWALYALSVLNRDRGNRTAEVRCMSEALDILPGDISLAKAALRCFYENGKYDTVLNVYGRLPEEIAAHPRCRVYYAFALAKTGALDEAEAILYENGGLTLPDLREGETVTLELWLLIKRLRAERKGETFDAASEVPPAFVDFRMQADQNWIHGRPVGGNDIK